MRQEACALVPLRAVPELVQLLQLRLCSTAEEAVEKKLFCGMPVDYRPRFVAQSLTMLCEASAAHASVGWHSALPALLAQVLRGELPNDAATNLPFGSPDVIEMSSRCRAALLSHAKKRNIAPAEALAALKRAPVSPKGTWAERGEVTRASRTQKSRL
ncbi:Eukaryotic translation initiation factor 2D [Durusdinium trenchii]|uniref:Eukaryotic translation initiation factor 2D n=1 Tax=Durusdinium trenchii TaxID=1381693 RepID=A0ABP0KCM8_9DINO